MMSCEPIWQNNSSLRSVFLALANTLPHSPDVVRFAGGCVRDSLLKKKPQDYDLATSLSPEEVMGRLTRNNIPFITPGLTHGTITALVDKRLYEITSLRRDLTPDGRHSIVAFHTDWEQDALRRDFTINALFMDWNGYIYDYVNGILDLKKQKVRFVGDPERRIQEDYLRILRWFRMNARFGDPRSRNPFSELFQKYVFCLSTLSKERKQDEFFKILKGPSLIPTLHLMKVSQVLHEICPYFHLPDFLERLNDFREEISESRYPILYLASLLFTISRKELPQALSSFRLSKKQTAHLTAILNEKPTILNPARDLHPLKKAYYLPKEVFEDVMILKEAFHLSCTTNQNTLKRIKNLFSWAEEVRSTLIFPLRGEDLIKAQLTPGPHFKKLLQETELFWLESKPRPSKSECLEYLKKRGMSLL